MSLLAWLSLLPICLLGAMSPGPSLAVVVRHTLGGSRGKGIVCAWAHSIGIGVYALITICGLAVLAKESPLIFKGISVVGGGVLLWLGINALRTNESISEKLAAGESTSAFQAARDGLAISLFNPKILIFFLALFSQFVVEADNTWGQVAIVLTPLIVDGLWYTFVAFMLSHALVLPRLKNNASLIDKLTGAMLILLAIRVFLTVNQ
ncbi:MAG: LysE family translocator [Fuerstiella sp.]|jgi:threonine/homoserine/homoserine lactone efflux protein|nr:LysE family translocator [Fuerstiella sp.]